MVAVFIEKEWYLLEKNLLTVNFTKLFFQFIFFYQKIERRVSDLFKVLEGLIRWINVSDDEYHVIGLIGALIRCSTLYFYSCRLEPSQHHNKSVYTLIN